MLTIAPHQNLSPGETVAIASLAPLRRILVVDDDEFFLELLVRLFSGAGYESDTALDGLAGWEAFKKKPYDLLITDYKMPRMTGIELIKKVRVMSDVTPCILMSSALPASETDLAEIVKPGAVLKKTFSFAGLLPKVKTLLSAADHPPAELRPTQVFCSGEK
jgi:DNA-binding response OmpR family regulator